jgi:hypothetical protein
LVPLITYSTASSKQIKKFYPWGGGGWGVGGGWLAGWLLSFLFLKIVFCFSLLILMIEKFINVPLAILKIYEGGVLSFISDTLNPKHKGYKKNQK